MPATNNVITHGWKGTFGKQVVFRQRNGKTFSSAYPDMSNRVLSPKQLKINELMKKANGHVRAVMDDEQSRNEAQVRLDVPRNKLYTSLIREYYKDHYTSGNGQINLAARTPESKAAFELLKHLLENTTRSIEEISRLTKVPADIVAVWRDKYRKPKEEEDIMKGFEGRG